MILSVLLGVGLNYTGIGLPWVLTPIMEILGDAALPLALLAVGAGLSLTTAKTTGGTVILVTVGHMLVMPLLMVGVAALLGIEG